VVSFISNKQLFQIPSQLRILLRPRAAGIEYRSKLSIRLSSITPLPQKNWFMNINETDDSRGLKLLNQITLMNVMNSAKQ